jgi:anti-anti-sigma factor
LIQRTLLQIDARVEATGDVVQARGELDLTNAHTLGDALCATTTPIVILDVSLLAFIDSAGIRTIDQTYGRLADDGRRLLVVAGDETRAAWTFRVAGFGDDFVVGSMDEAEERAATHDAS